MKIEDIKFRVWDKRSVKGSSTKEMLYDAQKHSLWYDFIDYPETYVLMQFIGIKDKNGDDIYEGDIVKYSYLMYQNDIETCVGDVFFDRGIFFFDKKMAFAANDSNFLLNSIEILGNIYENSDLLKQIH